MKELKKYLVAGLLTICLLSSAQAQDYRGDVNLNGFEFEIGDWVKLYYYLLGQETITSAALQETDINYDDKPASMADFVFFLRVIFGSWPPVAGPVYPVLFNPYDLLAGQFQNANPGDVVNFPIHFRNFQSAGALSFNVRFDPNQVSLLDIDTVSSRLSFWDRQGDLNFVQGAGQLFMFAFCEQCMDVSDVYSKVVPPGQGMVLNLKFQVSGSAPVNTLLPIEFITEENLGHYNAYANTQDPSRLIIPSVFSAGIYTGTPAAGDVYTDGKLNVIDIVYLANYVFKGFLAPNPYGLGDLDSSGKITLVDVMLLVNQIY